MSRWQSVSRELQMTGFTIHLLSRIQNSTHSRGQPWTAEMPMAALDEQMYEYACHEGNYSLPAILAGARREEMDKNASR